jgi:hypothetical protein
MTIPGGTGKGVHVYFANGQLQISKSIPACTQHTCVIYSAGKFIAIFRGELSRRSAGA